MSNVAQITEQLPCESLVTWSDIATSWLHVLQDPLTGVPIFLAWAVAFIYSRTTRVQSMKRKTERELQVYAANFVISTTIFAGINYDTPPRDLVLLTLTVGAASVLMPLAFFYSRGLLIKNNKEV